MISIRFQFIGFFLLGCAFCVGQSASVGMPDSLVIARHTFFDFGPPFNYYELIQVKSDGNGLSVQRALATPAGQACIQPATVESETGRLQETMATLLAAKNPCAISEKELHRELKRCKRCLTFSGVIVMMQVSCAGKERRLRMDILDRDLFDPNPYTPENTSWTMSLLAELDKALGPGPMDQPMFSLGGPERSRVPDTELVRAIRDGQFDELFDKEHTVSKVVLDANKPLPPPPSVEIESVTPAAPISSQLPIYPPIAKAARVEGLVTVTFDVSAEGKVRSVAIVSGPKMLELAAKDAVSVWNFPESAYGKSGQAAIRFSLNCKAGPSQP